MKARYNGQCQCGAAVREGMEIFFAQGKVQKCPACAGGATAAPAAKADEPKPTKIAAREARVALPASQEAAREAFDARWTGLDADQRTAASWRPGDGNVQVIAAAGSGKTATMVALVGRLLWDKVVGAGEIIVTTFTSKAGKELVARLAAVLPLGAIDLSGTATVGALRAGTFHGLALRSLRREAAGRWDMSRCLDIGKGRSASIPHNGRLWSMVLGYAGETGLPGTGKPGLDMEDADVRSYMLAVDVARAQGLRGEALREALSEAESDLGLPDLVQAYDLVAEAKFALGAWDFADVLDAYLLGLEDKSISDGAKVVIVDEAQDNNPVQIKIATLLARNGGGEVLFVGDLRQSIYSWRGAKPALFRDAGSSLNAKMMVLPTNYRSVSRVVDVGNRVSDGKSWSLGPPAKAHRQEEGLVTVQGYEDPAAEAEAVAAEVGLSIANGQPASNFAVLVRTNAMAGCYEAAMVAAKIPCVVVGGTPFFARKEVKDVLAYIALTKRDDVEAFGRIVNRPRRYLGKKFVSSVEFAMKTGKDLLTGISTVAAGLYTRQRDAAHDLRSLLITLRAAEWPDVVERIASILAPVDSGKAGEADEDRSGIPAAVAAVAKQFDSCEEFLAFAARCAGEVAEAEEGAQVEGRVTISTLHKAKGLEWHTVFLSASAGVFPHSRCDTAERLEEEERLFYVGATRARDVLHLTYGALNLRGLPAGPSRFLAYAEVEPTEPSPEGGEPAPLLTDGEETTDRGAHATSQAAFDGDEEFVAEQEARDRAPLHLVGADDAEIRAAARPADAFRLSSAPAAAPVTVPTAEAAAAALFGADAWGKAEVHAERETAKEPHATEGEGGRYVEVVEQSFDNLLGATLGFQRGGREVTIRMHQRVWERPFQKGEGTVWLRVYSTIPAGDAVAREVGEDSIKVAAVYEGPDGKEKPLHRKLPYAARTRGWRVTLLSRIAEIAPLVAGPSCPKCGAPMATRTSMRAEGAKPFLGCCRYPACNGTRKVG
jgi:DNA helicase-2/ATP-dependent DNA helicase PcrA